MTPDEIYNFALQVRPAEEPLSIATNELGTASEQPMSVPDHTINTPYEGGDRSATMGAMTIGKTTCLIPGLRESEPLLNSAPLHRGRAVPFSLLTGGLLEHRVQTASRTASCRRWWP